MGLFDGPGLSDALAIVRKHLAPTPQYRWPLIEEAAGCEVWVKHENHTPTAAFKVRGGLVYLDALVRAAGSPQQVGPIVTATRGNHGQALAYAAGVFGVPATIVVPEGNDPDQNDAMRSRGANLVVHGHDFSAAKEHSAELAEATGGRLEPVFHPDLVRGVATYAAELFDAAGELDAVYVPVGMGSGICGLITVRDLLGLRTEIVGVVSSGAPAAALSFAAGKVVETERAETFADGIATRQPDAEATAVVRAGAADVVAVDDAEIRTAMRLIYRASHNVAEGAGAAALAGLLAARERRHGQRVGVVLSGGNISGSRLAEILG